MTILKAYLQLSLKMLLVIGYQCICNRSVVDAFVSIQTNCYQRYHLRNMSITPKIISRTSLKGEILRLQPTRPQPSPISYHSSLPLGMAKWKGSEDVEGANILKSCIPYLLPLLDGELFGRYIYEQVPLLGFLDSLFIGPLYEFYNRIPFLGLILFIALTLGTRSNTEMNWNVRFNAQQAALIDVALVFPELIGSAFEGENIPR
jgi:hypothetical protein